MSVDCDFPKPCRCGCHYPEDGTQPARLPLIECSCGYVGTDTSHYHPTAAVPCHRRPLTPVTDEDAFEILHRFVASHFNDSAKEHARTSIPADPERDDDLRLARYIRETSLLRAAVHDYSADANGAGFGSPEIKSTHRLLTRFGVPEQIPPFKTPLAPLWARVQMALLERDAARAALEIERKKKVPNA